MRRFPSVRGITQHIYTMCECNDLRCCVIMLPMKTTYITSEAGDRDAWICICGNRPIDDGFYSCDSNGNEVDPNEQWISGLYVCARCGRMIRYDTLEVAGRSVEKAEAYERLNGTVFS